MRRLIISSNDNTTARRMSVVLLKSFIHYIYLIEQINHLIAVKDQRQRLRNDKDEIIRGKPVLAISAVNEGYVTCCLGLAKSLTRARAANRRGDPIHQDHQRYIMLYIHMYCVYGQTRHPMPDSYTLEIGPKTIKLVSKLKVQMRNKHIFGE